MLGHRVPGSQDRKWLGLELLTIQVGGFTTKANLVALVSCSERKIDVCSSLLVKYDPVSYHNKIINHTLENWGAGLKPK